MMRHFMSSAYFVEPLAREQVSQAFPLVSVLDPDVRESQWVEYANAVLDKQDAGGSEGILAVQNEHGHIYGLSVYMVKQDLNRGQLLEIENFAVADPLGGRAAARALLTALENLARNRDCYCVSLGLLNPKMRRWLREPHHPAADLFRSAGFSGEPLRLRKCFDRAN